jgi:hypothetical protein
MIRHITEPMAFAVVRWLSLEQGGRSSGPPTAQVYAATCIFPLGDDREVHPDWPSGAEHFSVLLEEVEGLPNDDRVCKVGFLAPDLARPFLHPGADVLIMEGPKVVANAVIREVVTPAEADQPS